MGKLSSFGSAIVGGLVVLLGQQALQRIPTQRWHNGIKEFFQKPEVVCAYDNIILVKDNDRNILGHYLVPGVLIMTDYGFGARIGETEFIVPQEVMKRDAFTFYATDKNWKSEKKNFRIENGRLEMEQKND